MWSKNKENGFEIKTIFSFFKHRYYCIQRYFIHLLKKSYVALDISPSVRPQIDNFRIIRLWKRYWSELSSSSLFLSLKNLEVLPHCHLFSSPFELPSTFTKELQSCLYETTSKKTEFQMETSDKEMSGNSAILGPCPRTSGLPFSLLLSWTFHLKRILRIWFYKSILISQSFICSPIRLSIYTQSSLHQIARHLHQLHYFGKWFSLLILFSSSLVSFAQSLKFKSRSWLLVSPSHLAVCS